MSAAGHAYPGIYVTGLGIISAIGHSVPDFAASLRAGRSGIGRLRASEDEEAVKIGAMLDDFAWLPWLESWREEQPEMTRKVRKILRGAPVGTSWSVCAALQAVCAAKLDLQDCANERTGIIVAGSNLTQSAAVEAANYLREAGRANPRYALNYLDSNQLASLSEILAIHGPGITVGAASASGNAAVFQAWHWLRSGMVDRCLVVGAGPHLSTVEREAFGALGAAFTGEIPAIPAHACRPFDTGHAGFVFGEASACVVLETKPHPEATALAEILGVSLLLDGNHLPDPNEAGEVRAMKAALASAGITAEQIGYINTHGTSSPLGDETEAAAIKTVLAERLDHVQLNSTKALTGHCVSAAGIVELIATIVQMREGFLHPNPHLAHSIAPSLRFAGHTAAPLEAEYALSNGFGFGGINSSLVIGKGKQHASRN